MGRLTDKVAFISGVARGQGRAHAVRLAREGADIVGVDLAGPLPGVPYESATPADLENAKAQFLGKLGRITELMKGTTMIASTNPAVSTPMPSGGPRKNTPM